MAMRRTKDDGQKGRKASGAAKKQKVQLIPTVLKSISQLCQLKSLNCHFIVENDPYRIDTVVYIGDSKSLKVWMKKEFNEGFTDLEADFDSADGMTIPCKRPDGSQFVLLWLNAFRFTVDDISVLIHEITHTSVYVLRLSGIHSAILNDDVKDSDDECLAYIMGQMSERILNELGKRFVKPAKH